MLMLCLAVDAPIRCSVWQYISQSKVDWIPVCDVSCIRDRNFNKINFLITELNKT